MKEKIKKYLETNDNKNTIIKSLWNAGKAVHSDIGLPPKKKKKVQINNVTYHLKELGKKQTKLKVSRRKEVKRSKRKNKRGLKNNRKKIKTKNWLFEGINKIDNLLGRLSKKKIERTHIK